MSESAVKSMLDAGFLVIVTTQNCSGCKQQDRVLARAGLMDMTCTVSMEYNHAEVEFLQGLVGPIYRAPTTVWCDQLGEVSYHSGPLGRGSIEKYVENNIFPEVVCEAFGVRNGMA